MFGDYSVRMTMIVADGVVTLDVTNDALVIRYGIPNGEHTVTIQRHDRDVDRVVIAGQHGTISLAATRFMADLGITYSTLNYVDPETHDRFPTLHSAMRPVDALLQRSQALAQSRRYGVLITRYLLTEKFLGQRDIATYLGSEVAAIIDAHRKALGKATLAGCRAIEAEVARNVYWRAWQTVELQFSDNVPDFWRTFESRTSCISGNSPRNASSPINAMLNYCYGVLEGETTAALYELGLNPILGILHTDTKYRASMAADMMEPARPMVDRMLLDFIDSRKFRKSEFVRTSTGVFRVAKMPGQPSLCKPLAEATAKVARECWPVWEHVVNMLVQAQPRGDKKERTPLTRNNSKRRYAK